MLRIIVDSGSSIRPDECEKYGVELAPLKILLGDKEYLDGYELSMDEFYRFLIEGKGFPKTSLPSISEVEEKVKKFNDDGDDVIILTISSGISGTYNAFRMLFEGNPKVRVVDSKTAVGGMRILVDEINKNKDKSLDEIVEILNNLIPRVKVMAIPETLEYLHRGGRLSKVSYIIGSVLKIKPVISLKQDGSVYVNAKKIGIKNAMKYIADKLKDECDTNYEIIPSYTYNTKNLEELKAMTDSSLYQYMKITDHIDAAIAAHWGPNAFGYIYVSKN